MVDQLPNRLRELRDERGWSLRELGQRAGMDFNSVRRLEVGDQPLDLNRMRQIARAFGVKPSALLNADDVEFRADERSMELLDELQKVPQEDRTGLLVAAREIMRAVRNLAAQTSSAVLPGQRRLVGELAEAWSEFEDDEARQRALDLWRAAGLPRRGTP